MKTILLIEDNEEIIKGLDYLFLQNEFLLLTAKNYALAKKMIMEKEYDLILLDVMLPDGDGFSLYKEMKPNIQVPVIFLTAKDLEDNIVYGFELGAVDYIVKPFHNRELILRIHNALKYSKKEEKVVSIKDVTIYLDSMKVLKGKKEIFFTALEYKILFLLIKNKGRIVPRETLMKIIWEENEHFVNDNTLTVYIKRIREKLGISCIKTIKGLGYKVECL